MNADSYFETDPWLYAAEAVQKDSLGRIVAFAVQSSCRSGEMEHALREWRLRIEELFGPHKTCDKLQSEHAISLLLRYDGPVIGRVFIDQSSDDPFCNFEIVGTDALLIWKPDVCALSTLRTANRQQTVYQHAYPTVLGKGAPL